MNKLTVCAGTDIVVIGQDPEMADYSNPRGDIHGHCAYVVVDAPNGRRWVHRKTFTSRWEDDALALIAPLLHSIESHLVAGGTIREEFWTETDPAYGSEAYVNGGYEAQRAYQERQDG